MLLQPEADLSLPRRMQMRVDFVDQHDAAAFDEQPAVLGSAGQVRDAIGIDQMAQDVGQQGEGRAIAVAHLIPGQLEPVAILEPQAIRVDAVHADLVRQQLVPQHLQNQIQLQPCFRLRFQCPVAQGA